MHTTYVLKKSDRARSMRVEVQPGGAVIVTVPRRYSRSALDRFLERYRDWIARARVALRDVEVIRAQHHEIATYKQRARVLLEARCAHFAALLGVDYGTITVRAQKRRWGSCSRAGNLSFNYKIALLPAPIADYIVVHELCHRVHFDHSRAFWALVTRLVPDHQAQRARLRRMVFRFH